MSLLYRETALVHACVRLIFTKRRGVSARQWHVPTEPQEKESQTQNTGHTAHTAHTWHHINSAKLRAEAAIAQEGQ